jgi:hypothetical protein
MALASHNYQPSLTSDLTINMFIRRGTDYNTVVNLTTCAMRRAVDGWTAGAIDG